MRPNDFWRRLQVWCHLQNLNDSNGSAWRHGRFWFHVGPFALIAYWNIWTAFSYLTFEFGGETGIRCKFAIPPIAFSLSLEGAPLSKYLPEDQPRVVGFSIHNWRVWWNIWAKKWDWSSRDPRWQHFSWNVNPLDLILGKLHRLTSTLEKERVEVPLPEGVYLATVEILAQTRCRPRWPWGQTTICTRIIPDSPIAIPGKGESEWDVGDDLVYELTSPAQTPREAVMALVRSCMTTRLKYGGREWSTAHHSR